MPLGRTLAQALHLVPPRISALLDPARALSVHAPLRVLEVACGTGALAAEVVRMLSHVDEYVVTDYTPGLRQLAVSRNCCTLRSTT